MSSCLWISKQKWLNLVLHTFRNRVSFCSMTALWRSFCEEQQKDVIVIETEIDGTGTGVDRTEGELYKTDFKANCVM